MKCILIVFMLSFPLAAIAQRYSDVQALKSRPTKDESFALDGKKGKDKIDQKEEGNRDGLYKFYIPSAMLSTGLEPAATSKLNLDFGDDKVELKYGIALGSEDSTSELNNSIGLKISASAPDGARTIFKYDDTPFDFSFTGIYTYVVKDTEGLMKINGKNITVSRNSSWINISGDIGRSKRTIFVRDTTYNKKYYTNFTFLVTYNSFFNAWQKDIQNKRIIYSFGAGYGVQDNYDDLDDHVLRKGSLDSISNTYTETETISGKLGTYRKSNGLLVSASIFKPISKPDAETNITIGLNVNSFGLGTSNSNINCNGGIYVSKRSYDKEEEELKEDFSFGVLADFERIDTSNEEDYFKDHFKVILTVQIPLRFK